MSSIWLRLKTSSSGNRRCCSSDVVNRDAHPATSSSCLTIALTWPSTFSDWLSEAVINGEARMGLKPRGISCLTSTYPVSAYNTSLPVNLVFSSYVFLFRGVCCLAKTAYSCNRWYLALVGDLRLALPADYSAVPSSSRFHHHRTALFQFDFGPVVGRLGGDTLANSRWWVDADRDEQYVSP